MPTPFGFHGILAALTVVFALFASVSYSDASTVRGFVFYLLAGLAMICAVAWMYVAIMRWG